MGTTEKLSVSLPSDLVAKIRERLEAGQASSISAFLAEAAEYKLSRAAQLSALLEARIEALKVTDPDEYQRIYDNGAGFRAALAAGGADRDMEGNA
ncbi:ribbon-helix-helix domain-containing protein [Sphaerisporangium perillae]|uniref:ribbon-helix-helix domain-containing protein n=1 Tax=Sphaerisporangium perillae TaxID=2935860 RepID=UPI00200C1CD4|nr:ribbon-helix-helix domain-containing protein [Sphaerisporangium perillae]